MNVYEISIVLFISLTLLLWAFFSFDKKYSSLKKLCSQLREDNDKLNTLLARYKTDKLERQKKHKHFLEQQEKLADFKKALFDNPLGYYWASNSCLTPNESSMYFHLTKIINTISKDLNISLFLFPQVSLHSFVKIEKRMFDSYQIREANKGKENCYSTTLSSIIAKHIDFLICKENLIEPTRENHLKRTFHAYTPFVGIEIDGSSHTTNRYGQASLERQRRNDQFKDNLFEAINISLYRYCIPDDIVRQPNETQLKNDLSHLIRSQLAAETKQA